ncbi:MAG: hypothetical protein R3C28_20135 [Pirellulaceae bacterium]
MHSNSSFPPICTRLMTVALLLGCWPTLAVQADSPAEPVTFEDSFSNGMDHWKTSDPDPVNKPFWKLESRTDEQGNRNPYLRCTGTSNYQPPHRSPHSIALIKDVVVTDFEFTATIQSTNRDAGAHRDLCLFWGYQDPSHFYYVHFGAKADPHACQIFIVNDAPRIKITKDEATGTPWTDGWHKVKLVRNVESGLMEVYFDNMDQPLMTAQDKHFTWGQVGIGTFDDHGNFDDIRLTGKPQTDDSTPAKDE